MPTRFAIAFLAVSLASCGTQRSASDPRPENSVDLYRALNGRFANTPDVIHKAFKGDKVDDDQVDGALAPYAPALEELARATRAPACAWTYADPPRLSLDYPLESLLTAARLLSVRAVRRCDQGDIRSALEDLTVLSKLGSDLQQDRALIGQLIGIKCVIWGCDALRDLIADGRLDREGLTRTEASVKLLVQRTPPFDTALRCERNAALALVDEIADAGLDAVLRRFLKDEPPPPEGPWLVRRWKNWLQATLNQDREQARRIIVGRWDEQLARLSPYRNGPLNGRPKTFDKNQISGDVANRMAIHALGLGPGREAALVDAADLLFMLWVPAMVKLPGHYAKARLWPEITRLGCTLELYRRRTGSYPDRLRDVGENPEDPFDGGELKYKRVRTVEGEGFVLAATGPDADAEARMRFLVEECRFDRWQFAEKYGEAELYTFGVFRRR